MDSLRQRIELIYKHRESVLLPIIDDYNTLPYALNHPEWRMRAYDANAVLRLCRGMTPSCPILEIGAWNGWLSHLLVRQGHRVTAIDYFDHPTDGLGAKALYDVEWETIPMDITDLSPLNRTFDAIVINHGLHFFSDPLAYVEHAKTFVKAGGLMILIGLTFFRDPRRRIARVRELDENHQRQHGVSLFLKPTRGYMDFGDKRRLESNGIHLYRHRQLWRARLKALIFPTAPAYFYGVWRA